MTGEVKSYSPAHGYGFITSGGVDYWFHINQFREINKYPVIGMKFEFDPVTTDKGKRVLRVKEK